MLFCVLGFGYSILLPTALKFELPYRTIVESLYNQFDCSFFGGYVTYYVLGHVLHEYVPKLSAQKKAALGLGGGNRECGVQRLVGEDRRYVYRIKYALLRNGIYRSCGNFPAAA